MVALAAVTAAASRLYPSAGDAGALYDALDQETRWNWMSIQKFLREA